MRTLSETVVVRLPKDVHVRLTGLALAEGVAVSKVVRRLIDEALDADVPKAVAPTLMEPDPVPPLTMPVDSLMTEVVGEVPRHYHKRQVASEQMINGVLTKAYRCGVCGVDL